jgi:hypothetical protein
LQPVQFAITMTDMAGMPVDLRAASAQTPKLDGPIDRPADRTADDVVVVVRRRSALDALLDAERRGAPEHEVRLLEEAAIAAAIARFRATVRKGGAATTAQRRQFERDCELLRRFPEDRRGLHGEDWFDLH